MNAADRRASQKIADLTSGQRVKIINSERKCGCGCKGADPWHRRQFTRTIRGLIIHAEPVVLGSGTHFDKIVIAQGTAKFPWGTEEVLLTADRCTIAGKWAGSLHGIAWKVADIA